MFEIITKKQGVELPPLAAGAMRYVLAAEGLYLERRTAMFTTSARVDRMPSLEPHTTRCELHLPPIPDRMGRIMVSFFRAAYEKHGGEAALLLLFHPARRRFRWYCPVQTVEVEESLSGKWYTPCSVEYEEPLQLPAGYVIAGDAHSHAWMSAYASAVDMKDEEFKDGLHIVIGHLDRPKLDVHIDFVMDGQRFAFEPHQVFEEPKFRPLDRFDRLWIDRIRERRVYPRSSAGGYASDRGYDHGQVYYH